MHLILKALLKFCTTNIFSNIVLSEKEVKLKLITRKTTQNIWGSTLTNTGLALRRGLALPLRSLALPTFNNPYHQYTT